MVVDPIRQPDEDKPCEWPEFTEFTEVGSFEFIIPATSRRGPLAPWLWRSGTLSDLGRPARPRWLLAWELVCGAVILAALAAPWWARWAVGWLVR